MVQVSSVNMVDVESEVRGCEFTGVKEWHFDGAVDLPEEVVLSVYYSGAGMRAMVLLSRYAPVDLVCRATGSEAVIGMHSRCLSDSERVGLMRRMGDVAVGEAATLDSVTPNPDFLRCVVERFDQYPVYILEAVVERSVDVPLIREVERKAWDSGQHGLSILAAQRAKLLSR